MSSKEATVYILDVGTTMRTKREGKNVTRLEETRDVLLKLLANKVRLVKSGISLLRHYSQLVPRFPAFFFLTRACWSVFVCLVFLETS